MSTSSTGNVSSQRSSDSHAGSDRSSQSSAVTGYRKHLVDEPARDVLAMLRDYAHEKPDVAAMWCFGIGVIVGWKLHP